MSDAEARRWLETATREELRYAMLQELHWKEEAEAQREEAAAERERLLREMDYVRRHPFRALFNALLRRGR